MRTLLICLILCVQCASFANAQPARPVFNQDILNNQGIPHVRIVNNSNRTLMCWITGIRFEFMIPPGRVSRWYRVNGRYNWGCR